MKKSGTLFLILLFALNISAQKIIKSEQIADHSIHVIGSNFEGCIFSKNYNHFVNTDFNSLAKFALTNSEILDAEKLLMKDSKKKQNSIITDPFIRKHLNRYLRQYVGFINPKGQKILLINFLWKKDILEDEKTHKEMPKYPAPNWKEEWVIVADGGNYYWQIKINLSSFSLFDFGENGVA